MAKHVPIVVWLFAVIAAAGSGAACGDNKVPTAPDPGPLTVTSVSPSVASVTASTGLRISGTGFRTGVTVTLGGAGVTATVLNSTVINVVAPPHPSGAVDIVVTNPGGETKTLPGALTYVAALVSITVTGNTSLTSVGETSQLTMTAVFSDGGTANVTREGVWTPGLTSVATVGSDGVLTARGLGRMTLFARYPAVQPFVFKLVDVEVTPPGTFAVSGRAREPGAGGLVSVRVLNVASGQQTMTNSDGNYSLGALTDSRLSFAREGWEPVEIDATPSGADDVPMQHIMRAASGGSPIEGRLAPNDLDYSLAAGGHCSPCRLVRITSATPGTVTARLTWTTAGVVLTLHANGQTYVGDAASRELSIDLAAGADDVLIYVGSTSALAASQHVPFTVAVTPSGGG